MVVDSSRIKIYNGARSAAKKSIEDCKNKFTKYNIKKYFKLYSNKENKDLFLEGDEPLGLINCISPANFTEEYGFNTWKEYNEVFEYICDRLERNIIKNDLEGSIDSDLEKDGGWIYYED